MKIKKVLIIAAVIALLVFAVGFLVAGFSIGFTEPFPAMLNQSKFFENWSAQQEYTKDYGVTLQKEPGKDFVVLNITDIQLKDKDYRGEIGEDSREMIRQLIEKTDPDLITLTGDNAWGVVSYIQHAQYIDSFGIPWAPVMGNHDGESTFGEFWAAYFYYKAENCLWKYGPEDMGYGNYLINIEENGKIIHSIFMMDTHEKTSYENEQGEKESGYDHLWPNQIQWYQWAVKGVEEIQGNKVESSVFIHIPVYEVGTVYSENYDKDTDSFTGEYAEDSFGVIHEMPCPPSVNNGFMDIVKDLGSTKNIFFGHDHVNNASFLYQGVRLTYNLKLGEGCYFEEGLMGGTTFTIDSSGSGRVEHIFLS